MKIFLWYLGAITMSWFVYLLLWAVIGARYYEAMERRDDEEE